MSKRKELLLESALSLFIEHGLANTTIQMILDQSGVSKGTFYKFFNSKEDCFHAIFEKRMQEDLEIRKSLEYKPYASDFDRLVDQIAVPMILPDKERVWELFWAGFYSGEVNSTKLASMQLRWLSERFIHLFGEEISSYASEGAILCYGMLHQIDNMSRCFHSQKPDWYEAVSKVLTYVGVLLRAMQERNEHIFDEQALSLLRQYEPDEAESTINKEALISDLQQFHKIVQNSKESTKLEDLAQGLLDLIERQDCNNFTVIEVVLIAFQKESAQSAFSREGQRIARSCWWYLEHVKTI
ncbi:TetR/AcrR family transcriptional regulator [Paenibacillus tuaregi]|uniref:TetR/AcrR family transcriptional regulator n=1 Tax=Paenibacillus tuaregi TaxID=1816681 RepID=UPI0008391DF1|nr:TetR/AcrR family transcriptional regulator [Paenibacillus tuaregi]